MELTVRIVSVSELKESTLTTRQGETKLLSKRIFIINDGYDEIACEMLGDRTKTYATPLVMQAIYGGIVLVFVPT
ncbi:MAG: hypothetical protein SOX54_01680 [Prevotella sp.]|nr:hypothetical protein [Prevotella sp.]